MDLQLPFLLPEDGHSCEFIKGLPAGLLDFLETLQNAGHCWLWQNTQGPGSWKKFMSKEPTTPTSPVTLSQPQPAPAEPVEPSHQVGKLEMASASKPPLPVAPTTPTMQQQQPVVIKLRLNKKNNGLGLSIVAARPPNQINTGIYVKSVVSGGAADDDGRLNAGDQLLAVDEQSLVNVSQERAAELMTKSGQCVVLTVAKDAATFHNLDALLNKSPTFPNHQMNNAQSMPSLLNSNSQLNQIQQANGYTNAPNSNHINVS